MLITCLNRSTDKAVLAVNGFAADGNMFVKKVKQRLEVGDASYAEVNQMVTLLPLSLFA